MTGVLACLCHRDQAHVVRLGTGLELLECRACGLYARRECPDPEAQAAHYRRDYWTQYAAEHATEARHNLFDHVIGRVQQRHPASGQLLDIGCGPGQLLDRARTRGWTAVGVDPAEEAARIGRAAGRQIRVAQWPVADWPTASVDAVTMVNVLDHLHDPVAALRGVWRVLRSGGVLYVRVPNGPFHVRLLARGWPPLARLSVFHLYGFGARALRVFLERAGFLDIDVRTAPLSQEDAYAQGTDGMQGVLRKAAKRGLVAAYQAAVVLGLDRWPWGPSLEATAVKPSV